MLLHWRTTQILWLFKFRALQSEIPLLTVLLLVLYYLRVITQLGAASDSLTKDNVLFSFVISLLFNLHIFLLRFFMFINLLI